jgi:hypothetical protein
MASPSTRTSYRKGRDDDHNECNLSPRHRVTISGESGEDLRIVSRLGHPSDERVLADPVRRQIGLAYFT